MKADNSRDSPGSEMKETTQAVLDRLLQEASKFESLANRPLLITYLETGKVLYASTALDRILGLSHERYMREGRAYLSLFLDPESKKWYDYIEPVRNELHTICLTQQTQAPTPFYSYDLLSNNPVTGLTHKLIVRSTCLSLMEEAPLMLATTFFDVSAVRRARRFFFHLHAPWTQETYYRDLEQGHVRKEPQILTEAEMNLVRLLRVVPAPEAARRLGLQPGTIQAKLKYLCRKTDSIGLQGLAQVCEAIGWC